MWETVLVSLQMKIRDSFLLFLSVFYVNSSNIFSCTYNSLWNSIVWAITPSSCRSLILVDVQLNIIPII